MTSRVVPHDWRTKFLCLLATSDLSLLLRFACFLIDLLYSTSYFNLIPALWLSLRYRILSLIDTEQHTTSTTLHNHIFWTFSGMRDHMCKDVKNESKTNVISCRSRQILTLIRIMVEDTEQQHEQTWKTFIGVCIRWRRWINYDASRCPWQGACHLTTLFRVCRGSITWASKGLLCTSIFCRWTSSCGTCFIFDKIFMDKKNHKLRNCALDVHSLTLCQCNEHVHVLRNGALPYSDLSTTREIV